MNKSNLMAIGVVLCILAACGSREDVDVDVDVDTVSSYLFMRANNPKSKLEPISEKDAKCLAKNFKQLASDDLWNVRVKIANGEMSEDDLSLVQVMNMQPLWALAGKECGVKLF